MNRRTRSLFAWSWIVLVLAAAAHAQPPPFAFAVSTPDPASHLFHVRLRCELPPADSVEFRMPAWTPGYYGLFDYAGNVRQLAAADGDGRTLTVEKSGSNAWTVRTGRAARIELTYDVLATNPFVANAFLDETRGYITPGALFVYVPGELGRPVTVTIELNPAWSAVATGLDPVPGAPAHTFAAADFDVLYDSPILMGNLEFLPAFEIQGVPHRFVGHALGEFDRRQFVDDLRAMVEAGIAIIGDIPYKHYTFLGIGPGRGGIEQIIGDIPSRHYTFLGIGPGRGGIEHANSAAVSFSGIGPDRAGRLRTLAFLAHEYFHLYNVKRIRPIALGPFDYDRPNVTNMLWVSEGFTAYYEYLMLARSGLMTQQELLDALSRTIAACENNPGRLFQSVTASSRETWTQGPFGRGGGVRKTISYYDKGAALGLLLDLRIRGATKNRRSLDTVMRTLYGRYYKQLGRGWTDEEFRRACEEAAGTGLAEIFEYASTTKAIDYARHLAFAGQARVRGGGRHRAGGDLRVRLHDEGDRLCQAPGLRRSAARSPAYAPGGGFRRDRRGRERGADGGGGRGRLFGRQRRPRRGRRDRVAGRRQRRCRRPEGGDCLEETRRTGANRPPAGRCRADGRGKARRPGGTHLANFTRAEAECAAGSHPGELGYGPLNEPVTCRPSPRVSSDRRQQTPARRATALQPVRSSRSQFADCVSNAVVSFPGAKGGMHARVPSRPLVRIPRTSGDAGGRAGSGLHDRSWRRRQHRGLCSGLRCPVPAPPLP